MPNFEGLKYLRETNINSVACPNCNHIMRVQPNGNFGGEVFYCPNEDKVFGVTITEIPAHEDFLKSCRLSTKVERVRSRINGKNVEAVENLLKGK